MENIIEKGNSGLFENEIEFNGKYAKYVKFLKDQAKIFSTFREIYVVATIIGFVEDRKSKSNSTNEKDKDKETRSIFASDLAKRKTDLKFMYQMIMLLDKSNENLSVDEIKNKVFKDDADEHSKTLRENMTIFHSYTCNGLEYLYEQFKDIDQIDDKVKKLYEIVNLFAVTKAKLKKEEGLSDIEFD